MTPEERKAAYWQTANYTDAHVHEQIAHEQLNAFASYMQEPGGGGFVSTPPVLVAAQAHATLAVALRLRDAGRNL